MSHAAVSRALAPRNAPSIHDVLDALPLYLATIDSDGVVVETNRAWNEFGLPPTGKSLASAWAAGTVEALARSTLELGVSEVISGARDEFEIEYPLQRHGETFWLALAAHRRKGGAIVSQSDVTARRRADACLVDQIGEASRLKSQFVAMVSHELRTPIHIVLGFTDLVLEGEFGELNSGLRDAMGRILFGARSLFELSEATLQLTRLDEGQAASEASEVVLSEVFEEAESEVRATQRDATVPIELCLAADLETVHMDRAKLKLLLKSLLSNGLKFTEHGKVTATLTRTSDDLEIVVEDTGVGIDDDALPTIFEAFRQADGSPARRFGGVGLGLHLVRRTVERLGGTVVAKSPTTGGARFEVTLPIGDVVS